MDDPIAVAQQLIKSAFPEAVAAYLGGSTARGEATAGSDLDLVVVRPEGYEVYRETTRHEGWPVELFVQTPSSTRAFFDWDRANAVPSLISMCATGLTLLDADGTASELRAEAARLLAAGPAPVPAEALETRRYMLTNLYDDLLDERPEDERAVVAALVLERAAELLLSTGGHWQGKGKWMPRMLRAAHPGLGGRLLDGYRALLAGGAGAEFAAAVAEVLELCGGQLREGYRRVADAKALAGPHPPAKAAEPRPEPAALPGHLVAGYLAHLGAERPKHPTVAALFALHRAHVERVPYETLDIQIGRPTTIDPLDSARRIAAGRGGYCFHLNGAFAALLTSLGYDVRRHVGGVQNAPEDPAGASANHLVLTVRCEGREFMVDVGLGDALHEPLPLREGTYRQTPLALTLEPSAAEPGGWRLAHDPLGSFTGMDFRPGPAVTADFLAQHEHLSTSPDSSFVQVSTVLRREADALEALRGCVLVRTGADGRTVTEVADREAWFALLTGRFGLVLDGPEGLDGAERDRLWAKVHGDHTAWKEATGWTAPAS